MGIKYFEWDICFEIIDALQVPPYDWIGWNFYKQGFTPDKLRICNSVANSPLTSGRLVWILWISNSFRWIIFIFDWKWFNIFVENLTPLKRKYYSVGPQTEVYSCSQRFKTYGYGYNGWSLRPFLQPYLRLKFVTTKQSDTAENENSAYGPTLLH